MGMDVYGLNPKLVGEKPERPDWNKATEEETQAYFKAIDAFEEANPGYYFRANVWAWRPIHAICDLAIQIAELPLSTKGWGDNSGNGLKNQEDCNTLADAIDVYLTLNQANIKNEDEKLYICLGMWVYADGTFVEPEKWKTLDNEYPEGTIMYNGIVDSDGKLIFPAYGVSMWHIREFVNFLRNCGGFEIC